MKVRSATNADLPMLDEMILEAASEVGQPDTAALVQGMVRYAVSSNQMIPVLEAAGGQLVGFCAWVQLPMADEGRVEGGGTWVAAPFRLQGWSEKLRGESLFYHRKNGGKYVVGAADANDIAACRSVEKIGFRPTKIEYRLEVR